MPPRQSAGHVGFCPIGAVGLVVVVLRYSRALWARWIDFDAPTTAFSSALLCASIYFGGSPRRWLFEEPDCRILHWDGQREFFATEVELTASELSSMLGVWRGRHPGPAQWALRDLSCVARCPLADNLAQGNAALATVLAARLRIPHPTQRGRSIGEVLSQERRHLTPLPRWHL